MTGDYQTELQNDILFYSQMLIDFRQIDFKQIFCLPEELDFIDSYDLWLKNKYKNAALKLMELDPAEI